MTRPVRQRWPLVLCLVSLAALFAAAPAGAADQIVYQCENNLCLINPDEPASRSLLVKTEDFNERYPSWSPDGTRVAYDALYPRAGNENWDVYTVEVGAEAQTATDAIDVSDTPNRSEEIGEPPAWSPDSSRLAFETTQSASEETDFDVRVAAADGTTTAVPLLGGTEARAPTWSADGTRIALECCGFQTYTTTPDGSAAKTLVGQGVLPSWSPDGRYIALSQGNSNNYVAGIRAADVSGGFQEFGPASNSNYIDWSTDSTRVTYLNRAGQVVVATVGSAGGPVEIPLPAGYVSAGEPSLSPDGTKVAFNSSSTGDQQILVAPADGSAPAVAITSSGENSISPDWKPGPVGPPAPGTPAGGGASPGGSAGVPTPSGGKSSGTKIPVKIKLAFFNHVTVTGVEISPVGIACNVAGSHPSAKVAEICAASANAYPTGALPSGSRLDARPKPALFAKGAVKVPAGKTKKLKMKLTAAGKKLLAPGRELKIKLVLTLKQGSAKPTKQTKTLTVEVPGKKR